MSPEFDLFGQKLPEGKDTGPHPTPGLSPKQRKVVSFLQLHEELTLDEATLLIGQDVFTNEKKHTGAVLANMVKRGILVRVKPGIFTLR